MFSKVDWSVGLRIGGIHKVDTSEILIGRHDIYGILTWDIHEIGQSRTRTYKDTFKAHRLKFLNRYGLADDTVCLEMYTHFLEVVNLNVNNTIGQTELWNTIF